jgi:uncharacterized C2H2 Zn-finger protein
MRQFYDSCHVEGDNIIQRENKLKGCITYFSQYEKRKSDQNEFIPKETLARIRAITQFIEHCKEILPEYEWNKVYLSAISSNINELTFSILRFKCPNLYNYEFYYLLREATIVNVVNHMDLQERRFTLPKKPLSKHYSRLGYQVYGSFYDFDGDFKEKEYCFPETLQLTKNKVKTIGQREGIYPIREDSEIVTKQKPSLFCPRCCKQYSRKGDLTKHFQIGHALQKEQKDRMAATLLQIDCLVCIIKN